MINTIHIYGIFTYIWLIFMVHVGKYTKNMDGMGMTMNAVTIFLGGISILLSVDLYG